MSSLDGTDMTSGKPLPTRAEVAWSLERLARTNAKRVDGNTADEILASVMFDPLRDSRHNRTKAEAKQALDTYYGNKMMELWRQATDDEHLENLIKKEFGL